MDPNADARIAAIASCQHSVFSRVQAFATGHDRGSVDRRLRSGRWLLLHPGVYGMPGAPVTWLRDLWAALLAVGPDAVVSHESAAALHRFPGFFPGPLTLNVPHGKHPRVSGAFVHQIGDVRAHHVSLVDGLPIATPARVVVDLAPTLGPRRLFNLLDDLNNQRRTSDAKVATCLAEVARRGKPGVRKLGAVLDERGPGYVVPGSVAEREFFDVLARGGLPAPERQVPLPGRGAIDGLVDSAYPDIKVLMEVDSRRWHSRAADMARDRLRDAEAARAGWLPLRFLYEHVLDDPADVCATVRDVRAARAPSFSRQ